MALADEVQSRVPSALLLQLTNQGSTTATTVDTTILGLAAADAAAEFELETGLELDVTIASHVAAGVAGALYYLHTYTGKTGNVVDAHETRWRAWMRRVAATAGADMRVLPQSSAPAGQVLENDRDAWGDFTLRAPRRRDATTDDDLAEGRRNG